jgi:hypothetical protein
MGIWQNYTLGLKTLTSCMKHEAYPTRRWVKNLKEERKKSHVYKRSIQPRKRLLDNDNSPQYRSNLNLQ